MISNAFGRNIDLDYLVLNPEATEDPITKQGKKLDEFHLTYVTQVRNIVGFVKPKKQNPNKKELTPLEKDVFKEIFEEYNKNELLKKAFKSYELFFHSFFVAPYGILSFHREIYGYGDYTGIIAEDIKSYSSSLEETNKKLKEKKAELRRKIRPSEKLKKEKEDLEKRSEKLNNRRINLENELKTIDFTRKINLPMLFVNALKAQTTKKQNFIFQSEKDIKYRINDKETIETTVFAGFTTSLCDNLFSDSKDCLFITPKKNQEGNSDLTFQKYWFGALLHSAHPKIRYLDFKSTDENIPRPLFRVKLMEAEDKEGKKYLVVGSLGGTLANDPSRSTSRLEAYVKKCIEEYFTETYKKGDSLVYNINHGKDTETPSNRFIQFIEKAYSLTREQTQKLELRVNGIVGKISNVDTKGNKFNQEQFSESFTSDKDPELGAFVNLEGIVEGYVIPHRKKSKKSKIMKWALGIAAPLIAGILSLSTGAYIDKKIEQNKNIRTYASSEYTFNKGNLNINCGSNRTKRFLVLQGFGEEEENLTEGLKKSINQLNRSDYIFTTPEEKNDEERKTKEVYADLIRERLDKVCEFGDLAKGSSELGSTERDGELVMTCSQYLDPTYNYESYKIDRLKNSCSTNEIRIPLSDISSVDLIRLESPTKFSVYIPFMTAPYKPSTTAALEITTKDGNKEILLPTKNLSYIGAVEELKVLFEGISYYKAYENLFNSL